MTPPGGTPPGAARGAAPELPDAGTWRRWGVEPAWSRTLDVADGAGGTHRWHVLDTGAPERADAEASAPAATIVCVHGNPTWAYAWKSFLARFAGRHRVVAVDQLSMGYSERVGPRRYAERVADLGRVVDALGIDAGAPLVLAAHDWGGAIAMGWAVERPERVAGMVLCNTGIGVPEGRGAPAIIRLAASAPLRDLVCRRTSAFVEGTVRLSGSRIDRIDREAFRAPYRRAEHRRAIEAFVGDVPLRPDHPSAAALEAVAARLEEVTAPVLLAWGARDVVFDDDFAADLAGRFPHARLERFADANHLVMAEADVAGAVEAWLADALAPGTGPDAGRPDGAPAASPLEPAAAPAGGTGSLFDGLERRRDSADVAVSDGASGERIDFATFVARVDAVAGALAGRGLRPGDRVAMLVPPGVDLIVAVYGVWRAGGVTVIADRGLGLRGLGAAIRSARPAWTIGSRAARVVGAAMRWAPRARRVDVAELMREAGTAASTAAAARGPVSDPGPDDEMAILFTSGATGPAKGVRYRHRQLAAQRDALAATYGIAGEDRLVAAFAPFALYGPALGVPTALADADVTKPGTLTARALDDACRAVGATLVFASPAALANVVATAPASGALDGLGAVRLVFSAGAPVPSEILRAVAALAPEARLHTPYGMTEALPVADVDLVAIDAAEADEAAAGGTGGVCVGHPVRGAEVRVAPLGFDALRGVPEPLPVGATGEILVRAAWVSEGYLGRWRTERLARPGDGWHRTGDVGHLDADGRLWVEGRSVHVIDTADGPLTSVPIERAVERALVPAAQARAGRVAAVGVGPAGCAQLVLVLEGDADGLADAPTSAAARAAAARPVAAVLSVADMPVDIRHNAKIDRAALARWASALLAGGAGAAARGA